MSDKKKDRPWDGRSRIPTQQYKENYNEIFKKQKTILKNNSKPNDPPKKPGVGTNLQISAEIVNGRDKPLSLKRLQMDCNYKHLHLYNLLLELYMNYHPNKR